MVQVKTITSVHTWRLARPVHSPVLQNSFFKMLFFYIKGEGSSLRPRNRLTAFLLLHSLSPYRFLPVSKLFTIVHNAKKSKMLKGNFWLQVKVFEAGKYKYRCLYYPFSTTRVREHFEMHEKEYEI